MTDQKSTDEGELATIRQLVIGAALTALEEDGLMLTSESITYAKVFEHLREKYSVQVTRGSVHERIWASHDHFRLEVVTEAVKYVQRESDSSAVQVLAPFFRGPGLTTGSIGERTTMFVRDYGLALFQVSLDSPKLQLLQSMKALGVGSADDAPSKGLRARLNQQVDERMPSGRVRTGLLLDHLGLRPKARLGLEADDALDLINSLTMFLYSGAVLNYRAGSIDAGKTVGFSSIPADSPHAWYLVSVAFKSILDFLCEVNPDRMTVADSLNLNQGLSEPQPTPELEVVAEGQSSVRRSRSALKRMVLNAGVELLLQDGLALVPDSLSYAKLLKIIEEETGRAIPRRLLSKLDWSAHEEFRSEVLMTFLQSGAFFDPLGPVSEMTPLVLRTDGSVSQRLTSQRYLSESLSIDNSVVGETDLQRLITVKAAMGEASKTPANDAVREVIGQMDRLRVKDIANVIRRDYLDIGFRVRPETGLTTDEALELLSEMSLTLGTGSDYARTGGLRHATRTFTFARTDGVDQVIDWTPLGVGLRAFFDQLFTDRETRPCQISDLKLNMIGTRGTGERLLYLIHGYGANEYDLADIVPEIDPQGRFFAVAPRGPHPISAVGAGWYRRNEDGSIEPSLFLGAMDALDVSIDAICSEHGFDRSEAVLVGFSQGGAMALATSLRASGSVRPAAAVCLSGAIPEVVGASYDFTGKQPEVLIQHGLFDTDVTIDRGRRIRELLIENGLSPSYREYPMKHEISPESLAGLRDWLAER